MARVVIELNLPVSGTRAIELHHAETALRLAVQDMKSAGGNKHGTHDIEIPGDSAGERVKLGTWLYEPSAEK